MKDPSESPTAVPPEPEVSPGGDAPLALGFSSASWRNAGREGLWVIASQVMTAVAGLAGVRILTELATREIVGNATLLFGVFTFARNVFLAPVGSAQLRFHPQFAASGRASVFTKEISRLSWTCSAALAALMAIALLTWRTVDPGVRVLPLMLAALAMCVADAVKSPRANQLGASRVRGLLALWTSAEAWLTVLCIALALKLWPTSESYLLGQAAGVLFALLVFGGFLFPALPPDVRPSSQEEISRLRRDVIRYALPFMPLAVVGWVSGLGDRYLLAAYLGAAEVGAYAAAYGLASRPFLMVGGVLNLFARPILFQAEGQGNYGKADRVFLLWLALSVALSGAGIFAFWLLSSQVAALLLAPHFRHADTPSVFLWVGVAYAVGNLVIVLENRILSFGMSRRLIVPTVAGAATSLAMNFLLIPRFGIAGASKAAAVAFFTQALLLAVTCAVSSRRRTSSVRDHDPGPEPPR